MRCEDVLILLALLMALDGPQVFGHLAVGGDVHPVADAAGRRMGGGGRAHEAAQLRLGKAAYE